MKSAGSDVSGISSPFYVLRSNRESGLGLGAVKRSRTEDVEQLDVEQMTVEHDI